MSEEIYHEVEEEIRQKELARFWQENRAWIIGGISAAVVFTGAMSWWRDFDYRRDVAATARVAEAVTTNDPAKMEGVEGRLSFLAGFSAGKVLAERRENEKAAKLYDDIASSRTTPPLWRDLARLYAAAARLDISKPADLHAQLAELAQPKAPFRASALELDALLYAREGKPAQARAQLQALIADPEAPRGLRDRASALSALYATESR